MTRDELARLEVSLLRWEGVAAELRRYRPGSFVPGLVASWRQTFNALRERIESEGSDER